MTRLTVEHPKIKHVQDLARGVHLPVEEVIGSDYAETIKLRTRIKTAQLENEPLYACSLCSVPVYLIKQHDRKGFFFRHEIEDDRCPAKTRGDLSQEEINARKYDGIKESLAHIHMKNMVIRSLEADPRFSDIQYEKRWAGKITDRWRKPDVSAVYDDGGPGGPLKVAFEVQLSTTFLDVIAERRLFYLKENALLFWIFAEFHDTGRRLMQDDIFFNNNQNAFVVTNQTLALSMEHKAFHVDCRWYEPMADGGSSPLQQAFVPFHELRIERTTQRAFHFDYDAALAALPPDLTPEEAGYLPEQKSRIKDYAKQELAKLSRLDLPGFEVHVEYPPHDGERQELYWRHLPTYSLMVREAKVDSKHFEGMELDVHFFTDRCLLAVDVVHRDEAIPRKTERLTNNYSGPLVQLDLSDLPEDASPEQIKQSIRELSRWKWLNDNAKVGEEYSLRSQLAYSQKILFPPTPPAQPGITGNKIPSRLIRDANSTFNQVKAQRLMDELRALTPEARPSLLKGLEREARLALHCLQIGLRPTLLPPHLMQTINRQSAINAPVILWQTGLFAKFCMTGKAFTAKQGAFWLRTVFPGMEDAARTRETANGFNEYSEVTYNFFNALGAQGLLRVIKGKHAWDAQFAPIAPTKVEVLNRLLMLPTAVYELGAS